MEGGREGGWEEVRGREEGRGRERGRKGGRERLRKEGSEVEGKGVRRE